MLSCLIDAWSHVNTYKFPVLRTVRSPSPDSDSQHPSANAYGDYKHRACISHTSNFCLADSEALTITMTCPQCREGFVLPGDPNGAINEEFQGAYLAPSPDGESLRAIVYLTDGFGLPLKNCKIMADKLAEKLQCDVWIPDYFKGSLIIDSLSSSFAYWLMLQGGHWFQRTS